jgi:hypothetical protein
MKKILLSFFVLITITAFAQTPFIPGNLVVVQVGSGAQPLSNRSQVIKLIEITTSGTIVQTIELPYTTAMATSGNNRITTQGSSSNDANMTLSANGQYFVLPGYNSDTGIATISGAAGVHRTLCRVAMNGTWDTKTLVDIPKSTGNARGAASNDGNQFYLVGSNLGVRYVPYGSTGTLNDTSITVSTTVTNNRTIQAWGGDLIVGTGSGAVRVGRIAGFPTTANQTMVQFPGVPTSITANNVYFTNLPGGPAGFNTMYFSSDAAPSGIRKYCLNTTTNNWDSVGIFNTGVTYRGMTASTSGSTVTIYAVSGNSPIHNFVDATGYNGSPSAIPVTVLAAPTNTAFRGIQMVPSSSALPIRLLAFNAAKNDDGTAKVFWVVNGDYDVVNYVAEKSSNGRDFTSFGNVIASNRNNYEMNDNTVLTVTTYYRVKFVTNDGKITYSNVVAVSPKRSIGFQVFPNPVQNNLILSYTKLIVDANISINTIDGKNVMSIPVKANTTQSSIDVSKLKKGNYVVTLLDADGNRTSKTMIKN